MKRTLFIARFPAAAALALALCACSGSTTSDPPASEKENRSPKAEGVQWPNLRKLDELAEKAEPLVDDPRRVKPLRDLAPSLKEAALAVAADSPPAGSKDAKRVAALQVDLRTLAESIPEVASAKPEDLINFAKSAHPIVEDMMEAANMPHVHEHEDQGGQDAGN